MNKLKSLLEKRGEIDNQISLIQSECNHPKSALDVKHKSDTGNYDPSADSYWTEYECGLCNKRWTEDA